MYRQDKEVSANLDVDINEERQIERERDRESKRAVEQGSDQYSRVH